MKAGLLQDETAALFQTWENSYFSTERGLKLFWIVPREAADRILPLKIDPVPEELQRVIIGRNDILTPEFERDLLQAAETGGLQAFASDKYYLAYLDFLARTASTATRPRNGYPRNGSSRSLSFVPYRMPWVVEAEAASNPRRAWDVGGRALPTNLVKPRK